MKKIVVLILLVVLVASPFALAAINDFTTTIDSRYTWKNDYHWTGQPRDGLLRWATEVEDRADGTTGNQSIFFDPTDVAPTTTEGRLYYNDTLDALRLYTPSGWVTLEKGGDYASLDEAYDGGAAISVDDGAVTLTASDAASNVALAIVQSDTGTAKGVTLTNAGTGNTIDIQNAQAGTDIEGTDDTWNVATTGVATFLSFVMENGGVINNTTNNEIEFIENSEQFSFAFNGNTLTYATDSGIDAIAFGVLDDLSGINNIAFDAAAGGITLNGTTNAWDLTINQTGTVDSSLILTSDGSVSDALSLITTDAVGSIKVNSSDNLDIDAADNITVNTAGGSITTTLVGGDFALDATDASIHLDAGEAVTDAINIDSAGGVDVDVSLSISLKSTENTLDSIEIVSTAGGIDITAAGAATEDIDIVNTAGSVNITAGENNAAALVIKTNGGTSESINIFADKGTSVAASTEHDASVQLHSDDGGIGLYTTANLGNAIRIETNGGVDENIFIQAVKGTGADSITLTSTVGGIALTANAATKDVVVKSVLGSIQMEAEEDAADAILIDADGGNSTTLRLIATTGTSVAEDGAAVTINAAAGGVNIQSDANLDDAITIRADGGVSSEITIHNDQGNTTDSIDIISDAGGIIITAAKPVVITNAFEPGIVYVPDGAAYTVLANNSGQIHIIPDESADITLDMPAEVAGMNYRFVYVGGAEDAQDWIIDTQNNTNFFFGGLMTIDDDDHSTLVVYSDETDDSICTILTPGAGTDVEMWCDGVNWYLTGTVISGTDTSVVFSNL